MNRFILPIAGGLVTLCLGGWVGFTLGHHEHHEEEAADEHDHDHGPELSPQTLQNLGIELRNLGTSDYVRSIELSGELVEVPLSRVVVHAPIDGVIASLDTGPGRTCKAGAPLLRMLRAALPRPELRLTAPVFAPINEHLHEALRSLRQAHVALQTTEAELARLQQLNQGETLVVSGQRLIDLGYERERRRQALANAAIELHHHGLSEAEIDDVKQGGHPERGAGLWQRALDVHDLWSPTMEKLRAALPAERRDRAWTLALLGELSAAGMADSALLAALGRQPALAARFDVGASLLLQGHSLAEVEWLAGLGALDQRFALPAPADAEDWDVLEVHVRPGQKVSAGAPLLTLHDPRKLWLRVEAVGRESKLLAEFVAGETEALARPLVAGLGSELRGLRPFRMEAGTQAGSSVALFEVSNSVLASSADARSWKLYRGLRFGLRIPMQTFTDQFVLPRSAVLAQGADQVVFLPDGDSFKPVPVRVLHSDEEYVVIANDGGVLSPGILMVQEGALALSLALQAGEGADHHHHH